MTEPVHVPYDKRRLSYSTTFTDPKKIIAIRALEWMTGKITLLRLIRKFENAGVSNGQAFWTQALDVMGIKVVTPESQSNLIPATGPVVVVANHPHGLVDGIVLADLIGRVREDYQILTRNLLTGVDEIKQFMLPVAFPHEENALEQNLAMRKKAMDHLKAGGLVVLFPSGSVASAKTLFGEAVEAEWNPFTAKMIQRSGAAVVPIFFPGQNSRMYQIAAQVSPTVRQGLLLHEVVYSLNKPQAPVIGPPIFPAETTEWSSDPRGFVGWLRDLTLAMKP